jgi:hypothetical protein
MRKSIHHNTFSTPKLYMSDEINRIPDYKFTDKMIKNHYSFPIDERKKKRSW